MKTFGPERWSWMLCLAVLLPGAALAQSVEDSGCQQLIAMQRVHDAFVRQLQPVDQQGHRADAGELREAQVLLCRGWYQRGATVRYGNGQVATYSWGVAGASFYFSNGRLMTALLGHKGASWYWPSGTLFTALSQTKGASLYWPNGRLLTALARTPGASWYYADGGLMSALTGSPGANWYCPGGTLLTTGGPELDEGALSEPGRLVRWALRQCGRGLRWKEIDLRR